MRGLAGALVRTGVLNDELVFDHIVGSARKSTGLTDFGADDWQEPLHLILQDLETTAALTPLGRVIARLLVVGLLRNRLRLVARAASAGPPVAQPIFILGLPRTGSTLLHELLAQVQGLRAPTFWESDSLPKGDWSDCLRVVHSAARIGLLNLIAPRFKRIHRLGSRLPHECVSIQALSFRSMQFFAIHNVAGYHEWLTTCDWRPAYAWHERYLRALQPSADGSRWLLKAPGHMLGIEALLDVYPDASFVQLHRDPCEVIPSMASLYATLREACSYHVDRNEIGRSVVEEWSRGVARVARVRARRPDQFVDLPYAELVERPIESAARLCERFEVELTAADENAMARYLARNPRGKHGAHRYTLAEFGLSEGDVRAAFAGP